MCQTCLPISKKFRFIAKPVLNFDSIFQVNIYIKFLYKISIKAMIFMNFLYVQNIRYDMH